MFNMWTGKVVRLRGIEPTDWEQYHQNDADTEAQRLVDLVRPPRSEQGTRQWAEAKSTYQAKDDSLSLAIETIDGELVGAASTRLCDPHHGTFNYGIAIFRPYWRKGYASDAVFLLLRYYFRELRYQKANANVYSFNTASLGLHEHLGFQVEGRLRRMIFTQGQYYDEFVLGMTVEEFEQRYAERLAHE